MGSFVTCILYQMSLEWSDQKGGIGGVCSTREAGDECLQDFGLGTWERRPRGGPESRCEDNDGIDLGMVRWGLWTGRV